MVNSINSNNLPKWIDNLNARIFKYFQYKRAYKIAVPIWAAIYFFFFCVYSYGAVEIFIFNSHAKTELPVLSDIWHCLYNLILPIVDLAKWYFFVPLVIIHVFLLPLVVGKLIKLITFKTYKPNVSDFILDKNCDHLSERLSTKAREYEYARYTLDTFKFCLILALVYFVGVISSYLYIDWNGIVAESSVSALILKILVTLLIIALVFFLFWGLTVLSYLICKSFVAIKPNSNFVVECARYSLDLEKIERKCNASSSFDIAKYNSRRGTYQGRLVQPEVSAQNTGSGLKPFNVVAPTETTSRTASTKGSLIPVATVSAATTKRSTAPETTGRTPTTKRSTAPETTAGTSSTPYVSIEEKIAAENAYYSGNLSAEELNKITSSYWEHHTNDEHWPDVGDG